MPVRGANRRAFIAAPAARRRGRWWRRRDDARQQARAGRKLQTECGGPSIGDLIIPKPGQLWSGFCLLFLHAWRRLAKVVYDQRPAL